MKIGIITMYDVPNYGTILQAFALQHKLYRMGYDAEIIDYCYFNKKKKNTIKHIVFSILSPLIGNPTKRREYCFADFCKKNIKLSAQKYKDNNSIKREPPLYDIYCTGSDQVWNPRFIKNDTTYMLDFVRAKAPKISYASSFACNQIPRELTNIYTFFLSQYDIINVRESNSVKLVKELTKKNANETCDPTLLLSAEDWVNISTIHRKQPTKPYILVYILSYMYNPYPEVYTIIKNIKSILNYKVVYLGGRIIDSFRPNCLTIKDASPEEFISLFMNASFVITDSFHGTAFSTIFQRPMLGLIKEHQSSDERLTSLLNKVGNNKSIIKYNEKINYTKEELLSLYAQKEKLEQYRKESETILFNSIKSVL